MEIFSAERESTGRTQDRLMDEDSAEGLGAARTLLASNGSEPKLVMKPVGREEVVGGIEEVVGGIEEVVGGIEEGRDGVGEGGVEVGSKDGVEECEDVFGVMEREEGDW